jgi:hypothetical protein
MPTFKYSINHFLKSFKQSKNRLMHQIKADHTGKKSSLIAAEQITIIKE